jgi:hypothetical protein
MSRRESGLARWHRQKLSRLKGGVTQAVRFAQQMAGACRRNFYADFSSASSPTEPPLKEQDDQYNPITEWEATKIRE